MADEPSRSHVWRWIIGVLAALAIVALLAYARRNPGFDDRVDDGATAAVVVVTPAGVTAGAA